MNTDESNEDLTSSLVFEDLEPIKVNVTIRGEAYVLCEADEDSVVKYKNMSARHVKMADAKVIGIGDINDNEPFLLSRCLFKLVGNGSKLVGEVTIRKWPHRVVKPLFERLRRISMLDDPETLSSLKKEKIKIQERINKLESENKVVEEPEGNSPESTGVTSD